jgi:hypothetical protein
MRASCNDMHHDKRSGYWLISARQFQRWTPALVPILPYVSASFLSYVAAKHFTVLYRRVF